MSGVLAFLNAAVGLVFGWAADLLGWLRRPGNWLKACCAVLAVLLAVACLASYRQGQQIVVVTRQVTQCRADAKAAADKATMDAATLQQNYDALRSAMGTIKDNLDAEAEKMRALQARNAQLAAQTASEKAKADAGAKSYRQQYDQRPPECIAALDAMAAACPALRGY
ncbi:hypothetical protein EAT51_07935 [Pseudoxanthomonas winnipegensis]|uniref:hypothetical protein n=1 Tax=Pseudoxanthomonas winnipegensis TaxID=2480810 RepID=UPI00102D6C72|nr:hypothetical protein [Pseudoxanthomonas winnipegensis]RZZ81945.1 hypothetical protein EA662_17390 [Pseudoxanthomonas winnipegensis]TAA42189.1 hypothetical protein EAT51_07935 [Pseudoxanthomonas winnipegensis]